MRRKILYGLLTITLISIGALTGYKVGYINNFFMEHIPKENYSIVSFKETVITNQETAEKIADRILREKDSRGDKPLEVIYNEKKGSWLFGGENYKEVPNRVISVIITKKGVVDVIVYKK